MLTCFYIQVQYFKTIEDRFHSVTEDVSSFCCPRINRELCPFQQPCSYYVAFLIY